MQPGNGTGSAPTASGFGGVGCAGILPARRSVALLSEQQPSRVREMAPADQFEAGRTVEHLRHVPGLVGQCLRQAVVVPYTTGEGPQELTDCGGGRGGPP